GGGRSSSGSRVSARGAPGLAEIKGLEFIRRKSVCYSRRQFVNGKQFSWSSLSFFRMHWDHEPLAVPSQTESADKSDALQTLRAVRRRPAVAKRLECVRLQRRFPKAGCNSMAGSVHGKARPSRVQANAPHGAAIFDLTTP